MSDIERAKELLKSGNASVVMCLGEETVTDFGRGISPLLDFISGKKSFEGFCAADKIVGKAAAMLFVKLGVKAVHGCVMSRAGLELLTGHGVLASYDVLTDNIINRSKDGICPMEQTVLRETDVEKGYIMLVRKHESLKNK